MAHSTCAETSRPEKLANQVLLIDSALDSSNVKKDLLPTKAAELVKLCSPLWEDNCTLSTRITAKQLRESYCDELLEAQRKYLESLSEAEEFLLKNLQMLTKMDSFFGCDEPNSHVGNEGEEKFRAKDGTKILQCPFLSCQTKTVKLKRHLQLKHSKESEEVVSYAIHAARILGRNQETNEDQKKQERTAKTEKPSRYTNTKLVSRRHNRKKCLLCEKLCINMGDHVSSVHSIDKHDDRYENLVKSAPVIPSCFTRSEGRHKVMLDGKELQEAQNQNNSEVKKQQQTLEKLKKLRDEMSDLSKKMGEVDDIEEYSLLKSTLEGVEKEYKTERYKDARLYSTTTQKWRDHFVSFLEARENYNPKRTSNMVMDIILPFEHTLDRPLKFSDLSDAKTVRTLLSNFKECPKLTATTKLKYLSVFELFVQFLLNDCDSPEIDDSANVEEAMMRDIRTKKIFHEVETVRTLLLKKRGVDRVATKNKAKEKLVSEREMENLLEEQNAEVCSVLSCTQEEIKKWDVNRILQIRNSLMTVAALRIGRRSKEIMTMQLNEVENAQETLIDGQRHFIINVANQKSIKSGEEAPVCYSDDEFKVLKLFIELMRPRLADKFQTNVFPVKKHMKNSAPKNVSFSSHWKILQSKESESGKKLSSRIIRRSRITSRNAQPLTDSEKRDMATAMNHTVSTADRYYNYTAVTDSVVRSLSLQKKMARSSGESFQSSTPTQEAPQPIIGESPIKHCSLPGPSGVKRKILQQESESQSELDEESSVLETTVEEPSLDATLVRLRTKKVMKSSLESRKKQRTTKINEVKDHIRRLVIEEKPAGAASALLTKTGSISIQLLTRTVPKEVLKGFSAKELREMIAEELVRES